MPNILEKIDAVTKVSEERIAMGSIQQMPKAVKIELTSKCNLRCKFCAVQTRGTQSNKDMDYFLFQKITEDMRIAGVEEIGLFFLGESFMNKELLVKATEWCKSDMQFPYVFLTSNAVAADSMTVGRLMDAGLDSLKWSVNSANAEQFNQITGGSNGLFDKALENIKNAYEVRGVNDYKTMLSASSILYEGEQFQKMAELLDTQVKPYVDTTYWLPLYQMSMYSEKIEKELGFKPTHGNMGRIDDTTMLPTRKPLPCWSAFTEGHVRVDGALSACCFGADERFDMGILDGSNFVRLWNGTKFQELRKAQLKTATEGGKALFGTPCEVCVVHK